MRVLIWSRVFACLLAGLLLSVVSCSTASPLPASNEVPRLPPPPPPPNGCTYLDVYVTTTLGPISVPNDGVFCSSGTFIGNNPNSQNVQSVTVQQSSVYGPNCNFTFNVTTSSGGTNTYVIKAQQNYCDLEAGDITASVVSGNATITKTVEGSYGDSSPGAVYVTLD